MAPNITPGIGKGVFVMLRNVCCASLLIAATCLGPVESNAAVISAENMAVGGETCCFTNPRYSGVCQVTTGPDETCADILAYLNNQASTGKTYCGSTKVRGGWEQVDCESSESSCSPRPSESASSAE